MQILGRSGGEQDPVEAALASLINNDSEQRTVQAGREASLVVIQTLQDQVWERYQKEVLLPRAQVWHRVTELLRGTPYQIFDTGLEDDAFIWRFGHRDMSKGLELITDVTLHVSNKEGYLGANGTMTGDMHRVYQHFRGKKPVSQLGSSTLLGVEPVGTWRRRLPSDKLKEAFSEKLGGYAFAASAELKARPFDKERLQSVASACIFFVDQDTNTRPVALKHAEAMRFVPEDNFDLTAIQSVLEERTAYGMHMGMTTIENVSTADAFETFSAATAYLAQSQPVPIELTAFDGISRLLTPLDQYSR